VLLRKPNDRRNKRPFGLYFQRCRKKSEIALHQTDKRNFIKVEMDKADLIEKYIQQKASDEELQTIKRLMAEDAAFKAEVSFQLELRQAVKKEENQALKLRLQQLEQGKIKRLQNMQKLWR